MNGLLGTARRNLPFPMTYHSVQNHSKQNQQRSPPKTNASPYIEWHFKRARLLNNEDGHLSLPPPPACSMGQGKTRRGSCCPAAAFAAGAVGCGVSALCRTASQGHTLNSVGKKYWINIIHPAQQRRQGPRGEVVCGRGGKAWRMPKVWKRRSCRPWYHLLAFPYFRCLCHTLKALYMWNVVGSGKKKWSLSCLCHC